MFAYPHSHRSTPLLLTSHLDAVPPFYPYAYNSTTGLISGRGTVDDKACIATQLQAILRLRKSAPALAAQTSLLFVTGEEVNGDGMRHASTSLAPSLSPPWRSVVFGEPTEHKLASGHKGFLAFHITVHGKTAHSGYPWLGHSATLGLIKALNALLAASWPSSELYGNSTFNIGLLSGGAAANVVAASARAECSVRIAGGSPGVVRNLVRDTISSITDEKIDLEFVGATYGPQKLDHDVDGFETGTMNYGTDVPNLYGWKFKRYLYGPGSISVAHGDHEGLMKDDLLRAVEGYERLIRVLGERQE